MHYQQRSPRLVWLWLLLALVAFLTVQCGAEEESARPPEVAPATLRWATWDIILKSNGEAEFCLFLEGVTDGLVNRSALDPFQEEAKPTFRFSS